MSDDDLNLGEITVTRVLGEHGEEVHVAWDDIELVTALGMLAMAHDTILGSAMGRDGYGDGDE